MNGLTNEVSGTPYRDRATLEDGRGRSGSHDSPEPIRLSELVIGLWAIGMAFMIVVAIASILFPA